MSSTHVSSFDSARLDMPDDTVMNTMLPIGPSSRVSAFSSPVRRISSPVRRVRTTRCNKPKLNKDGSLCMQGKGKKQCKCGYRAKSNRTGACPNCGSRADWIKSEAAIARAVRSRAANTPKAAGKKRKCDTPQTIKKSKKPKHTILMEDDTLSDSTLSDFDSLLELCGMQDMSDAEINARERALSVLQQELDKEKERILDLTTELNAKAEKLAKQEAEITAKEIVMAKKEAVMAKRKAKREAKRKKKREKTWKTYVSTESHACADALEDLTTLALGDDNSWPNIKVKDLEFDNVVF